MLQCLWEQCMKVKVIEDKNLLETEIEIHCLKYDHEIEHIVSILEKYDQTIIGKRNNRSYVIKISDIYYMETIDSKTFLYVEDKIYESNMRLSQIEKQLLDTSFIRISKSMLLNVDKIENIKVIFNGRYEAILMNQEKVIINRRYVSNLKKILGL